MVPELTSAASGWVTFALALGVLVALAVTLLSALGSRAALARMEQRLDEAARVRREREQVDDASRHARERLRREEHAALLQTFERRIGESAAAQAGAGAALSERLAGCFDALRSGIAAKLAAGHADTLRALGEMSARHERRHGEAMKALHDALARSTTVLERRVGESMARTSATLGARVDQLARVTGERLDGIGAKVESRLSEGFEKTTATFHDVLRRLALIDEAQKRITELSANVVSLQEVLADKRARGAFGEVQLNALVADVMPPSAYALQHTLGNGRRADCVLFLPEPTGTIAIDAKFPLESFQRMNDPDTAEVERKAAERQFRSDVRAHVKAIAERYIVPGETSDGAIMFVPAEAVFAEIQGRHPEVVQEAQRARVWLASPTTLLAILNTARAVLKDEATRRQVHVIRRHLAELARDFDRFRERMDRLATHMDRTNRDVQQVHTSARRISRRFETIEQVEMHGGEALADQRAAGGEATGSG